MNLRVLLLAAVAFVVGTVELIVEGVLDLITVDLHISVSAAGQFITAFSMAFALSAPILMNLTAKLERKTLYLISLGAFLLSNLMIAFSSSYHLILFARVLSAMSGVIIIVLSITLAPRLASPSHKGRALGIIYMGISGSLVLGVPIGMLIGNAYGWRAPFLLIAGMSALAILGITVFLKKLMFTALSKRRFSFSEKFKSN
ncbi:MFS transporter [Paenibacillus azoreducens]|uniref:MFS transporter n=1 Tax=Paenibacillus azoreducens TaxID=116718 RepID=UPI0039F50859